MAETTASARSRIRILALAKPLSVNEADNAPVHRRRSPADSDWFQTALPGVATPSRETVELAPVRIPPELFQVGPTLVALIGHPHVPLRVVPAEKQRLWDLGERPAKGELGSQDRSAPK